MLRRRRAEGRTGEGKPRLTLVTRDHMGGDDVAEIAYVLRVGDRIKMLGIAKAACIYAYEDHYDGSIFVSLTHNLTTDLDRAINLRGIDVWKNYVKDTTMNGRQYRLKAQGLDQEGGDYESEEAKA